MPSQDIRHFRYAEPMILWHSEWHPGICIAKISSKRVTALLKIYLKCMFKYSIFIEGISHYFLEITVTNTFIEHLLCARICSKYFTWINISNPHNNPLKYVFIMIIPIFKRRNWDKEKLNKLHKSTQLGSNGVMIQARQSVFRALALIHYEILCSVSLILK